MIPEESWANTRRVENIWTVDRSRYRASRARHFGRENRFLGEQGGGGRRMGEMSNGRASLAKLHENPVWRPRHECVYRGCQLTPRPYNTMAETMN